RASLRRSAKAAALRKAGTILRVSLRQAQPRAFRVRRAARASEFARWKAPWPSPACRAESACAKPARRAAGAREWTCADRVARAANRQAPRCACRAAKRGGGRSGLAPVFRQAKALPEPVSEESF